MVHISSDVADSSIVPCVTYVSWPLSESWKARFRMHAPLSNLVGHNRTTSITVILVLLKSDVDKYDAEN